MKTQRAGLMVGFLSCIAIMMIGCAQPPQSSWGFQPGMEVHSKVASGDTMVILRFSQDGTQALCSFVDNDEKKTDWVHVVELEQNEVIEEEKEIDLSIPRILVTGKGGAREMKVTMGENGVLLCEHPDVVIESQIKTAPQHEIRSDEIKVGDVVEFKVNPTVHMVVNTISDEVVNCQWQSRSGAIYSNDVNIKNLRKATVGPSLEESLAMSLLMPELSK